MPFTPAHAAAVLPLAREPWVMSALVAGSMAPDMPYFARLAPLTVTAESWYEPFLNATTSHSISGTVTVALPYALLLAVFWWVAYRPLTHVLTRSAEHRLPSGGSMSQRPVDFAARLGWVLASAAVGIATHLAWDALAHTYRPIQHASTALGMLILLVFVIRHPARPRPQIWAWVALLLVASAAALAGAWAQGRRDATSTTEHLLRAGAEAGGISLGVALAIVVAGWWLWHVSPGLRGSAADTRR